MKYPNAQVKLPEAQPDLAEGLVFNYTKHNLIWSNPNFVRYDLTVDITQIEHYGSKN